MLKIAHRINTIEQLKDIPPEYGVEIDLRADGDKIILHHEPFAGGEDFSVYLKAYRHAFMVLNIKEAGIEQRVIEMVEAEGIKDFFLLDVEFPYIYQSVFPSPLMGGTRLLAAVAGGEVQLQKIAVRYSEAEPIEQALVLKGLVEWVWIDTNTKLSLDKKVVQELQGFKTCLVSPDRWGRPDDIVRYREQMSKLRFVPDAIMVGVEYIDMWK